MKKAVYVVLVLAVVAAVLCGCTTAGAGKYNYDILEGAEGNANADFDYSSIDKLQETDWVLQSGGTASDVFSIVDNGDNSENYLRINTNTAGYASVTQKLFLKPFSYYKISYRYTISTIAQFDTGKGYHGLFVGFAEDPQFNVGSSMPTEELSSVSTPKTAYFYFRTNSEREVTLSINVGTEDKPVKANVVLQNIALERVHRTDAENDADYPIYSLRSAVYGAPSILNVVFVVLGAVGCVLIGYAVYMLIARSKGWDEQGNAPALTRVFYEKKWLVPLVVAGLAALVRLLITLIESGVAGTNSTVYYGYDLEQLAKQGVWLAQYGTPYFYQYFEGATTFPVPMYLSMLAGLFGRLIGLSSSATDATVLLTTVCMIKLFAVMADIGTVLLLYNFASKRFSRLTAGAIALSYALMPALFSVSAGWGVMESITAFFLVLTFARLARNDYYGSAAAYFAAAMTTPAALYVSPMMLFYAGYRIYLGIRNKNHLQWIGVVGTCGIGLLLYFLITLPYTVLQVGDGQGTLAFKQYVAGVQQGQLYTMNAFNFQALLGNNYKQITTEFLLVAVLFALFVIGVFAAVYFRNRASLGKGGPKFFDLLTLSAGFIILYYSLICVGSNQASMLIVLPLLLIAAIYAKDKRLYGLFVMFSTLLFINTSYVYTVAGYTDAGVTQIGYETPILYIMGAVQLVAVVYAAYVLYDVIINRKGSEILALRVPYLSYVKSRAQNAVITLQNAFSRIKAFFQSVGEAIKASRADNSQKNKDEQDDK